ncbi:MAG: TetR/AcrR family transcriptional regulator [Aeromicrobium sp.]
MSPRTAVRQRAAHLGPERRRPQVLDAALSVAVREGLGAVTIGSVADEMGVTRPVVYACFDDRVEMVDALLEREREALLASVLAALRSSGPRDDPEPAFVDGFAALLAAVDDHPDSWRLLLFSAPDPAVAGQVRAARALAIEAATSWIGPAMARWWRTPELDRKLPALIELFTSSCEAAVRTWLDENQDWDRDELAELYGLAVCRALRGS